MFSKILYPTKFYEFSLPILKSLTCLKSAGLREIVLLYVIDEDAIYFAKESGLPVDIEQLEKSATEKIQEYVDSLKAIGIEVKTKITSGKVVNEIIKEASLENVSLIVTGRHKRHMIDELFIGSTTDGIVKKSSLPVLVVKYHTIKMIEGKLTEQFCLNLFRKILYATDWPDEEDASLIVMGSHGKGFIKEILLGSVSQRVLEYSDCSVLIVK